MGWRHLTDTLLLIPQPPLYSPTPSSLPPPPPSAYTKWACVSLILAAASTSLGVHALCTLICSCTEAFASHNYTSLTTRSHAVPSQLLKSHVLTHVMLGSVIPPLVCSRNNATSAPAPAPVPAPVPAPTSAPAPAPAPASCPTLALTLPWPLPLLLPLPLP